MLALALAAVLSLGVAAVASAVSITLRAGYLVTTFGGTTSPKALSKTKYTPIVANLFGKISTSDGTHPPAFRETVVDIDKDVKVNVKGYPVCKAGQLEARDTKAAKAACGKTILGEGKAEAEIAFPEQKPIKVPSPLLVFNGGEKGGKVTLLIHTFITVPAPTAIVTTVTISRKGTGLHSIAKVPVIPAAAAPHSASASSWARPTPTRARRSATSKPNAPTGSSRSTFRARPSRTKRTRRDRMPPSTSTANSPCPARPRASSTEDIGASSQDEA